jgi:hypothetical protein
VGTVWHIVPGSNGARTVWNTVLGSNIVETAWNTVPDSNSVGTVRHAVPGTSNWHQTRRLLTFIIVLLNAEMCDERLTKCLLISAWTRKLRKLQL